jgi:hypothetical protein
MENLTLEEVPPQGAPGGAQMPLPGPGMPPPPNQQLPPQMFTTAAQLLDMTDSTDFSVFTFKSSSGAVALLSAVALSLLRTFQGSSTSTWDHAFTFQGKQMG